jgi:hypothetical protein
VTTKKAYDSCRKEGHLYATQPFTDRTLPNLGAALVNNLKALFGGLDTGVCEGVGVSVGVGVGVGVWEGRGRIKPLWLPTVDSTLPAACCHTGCGPCAACGWFAGGVQHRRTGGARLMDLSEGALC